MKMSSGWCDIWVSWCWNERLQTLRWLSQQIITLQHSVESWCETSSLCGCAPASWNYAAIFWAASHKHTLTLTYHETLKVFQSHMTCWKASVRWITFPFAFVCVKLHLHHTHTHTSKDTESNNSVDINKGAIIMNVIRSAEGKEKMSKKIYYPLGCVLKHTFWFSTVQGQMSPLFVH